MREKERFVKSLVSIFFAFVMICMSGPVFAEGEETDPSSVAASAAPAIVADGNVRFLENEPEADVVQIEYDFLDTKNGWYRWSFPYSDSFFRTGPDQFSMKMAQGSLGMSLSAFRSTTGVIKPEYETYLREAGFSELYSFGYDQPTTENSLSGVIGMKKIDDFTVIAAVTCGQGYGNEWAGNLMVGDEVRHEGFSSAAATLEGHLRRYINDHNIEGKKKLWLTGISRAGAVANITAADMLESGEYDDVYAYLFGVPRTTKEPVAYAGIYNICGQYDPVAAVPFQSWGYERYGVDLFTPAQESDANYTGLHYGAMTVGDEIGAGGFRNNPEVNYQLRLLMEAMNEFFSSSGKYAERLQPLLLRAMREKSENGNMTDVITEAIAGIVPKNSREAKEQSVILDYLSYVTAQHMKANQRQVEYGSWDPDEPLEANLVIEHRPVTYVNWLFSTDDPEKLFSVCTESRRVTIIGDVDVAVYRDGMGIIAIDNKGFFSVPEDAKEAPRDEFGGAFVMRNGQETVINLPSDRDHDLVVTVKRDSSLTIYDILVSAKKMEPDAGMLYTGDVHTGQYTMHVAAGKSPDEPVEAGDEQEHDHFVDTEFNYSPTMVMSYELNATKGSNLSLSVAVRLVTLLTLGMALLLIVCLVIHRVHNRKVKEGHNPFSDWFIIVPHLIVIAGSAIMTQYVTYYLFAVGRARAICAAVTMFYIFLLAIRGAIKSREPIHFLIAGFILIFVNLTAAHYNSLPIDAFSIRNMMAFFVMVGLLSALAVRMFRKEQKG